ncbi:histamine H3 receptor-like [Bombina bombina]|uniref:histamine H3 receptor-like n=1 Tax=Bombina bombina TaxID=8345 RepID=UPI00235A8786|nr:histamine H3 receptor-like [Bombina bombina]
MLTNVTNNSEVGSSFFEDVLPHSQGKLIFLYIFISLVVSVTVIGNTLVILAFVSDKRIRNQSNFFLLNLAICDFFIGAVCIPLSTPFILTGKWTLGRFLCKLWLIADNLMCTASVFNILLISYDRFFSITMAIRYRSQQKNHTQTILKMGAVWILSFLLYSPAIIFWKNEDNSTTESDCVPGYYLTWYFLLGASTFDFYLPLISISFFNLSVYWNIRTRSRKKRPTMVQPTLYHEKEMTAKLSIISGNTVFERCNDTKTINSRNITNLITKIKKHSHITPGSTEAGETVKSRLSAIKLSRDKKAAKSLALLVCVFGVCWAPYTCLQSVRAACHNDCVESYWNEITAWLLWLNSSVNPIMYPLCHRSFSKAIMKIFNKFMKNMSLKF